ADPEGSRTVERKARRRACELDAGTRGTSNRECRDDPATVDPTDRATGGVGDIDIAITVDRQPGGVIQRGLGCLTVSIEPSAGDDRDAAVRLHFEHAVAEEVGQVHASVTADRDSL